MEKKTLLINFYGGPGCGKSTICAGLFYQLKILGYNCEMALEFAKDKVWEESYKVLDDQIYILGKQFHKLYRLKDKVDIIITDSPILLGAYYQKTRSKALEDLILECRREFNNIDIFLERSTDYDPNGRMQTQEEALKIDDGIKLLLQEKFIEYTSRPKEEAIDWAIKQIISYFK
jgi:hypothetical protein